MSRRSNSSNKFRLLRTQAELLELWPFFLEGLTAMNDPRGANMQETPERFFKVMSWIISSLTEGGLAVLESKNGKPLGYIAAHNATPLFSRTKTLWVYALYSNGKCETALKDIVDFGEEWARQHDFQNIEGFTGRFSGASFRWYEKKLGWKRHKLMFRKELR